MIIGPGSKENAGRHSLIRIMYNLPLIEWWSKRGGSNPWPRGPRPRALPAGLLLDVAVGTGLEPVTHGLTDRCSAD